MSGSDVTPSALRREPGTPDKPLYRKQRHERGEASNLFFVVVDEGWRTWILCTAMYEDKADRLIELLEANGVKWDQG